MTIAQWSTTPGTNASASDNVNWAEGQAPSTVNNSSRQEMADVADWYRNDAEWIDRNDSATFSSGTIVTFTGTNLTAIYNKDRRVRTVSSTPGTLHGTIIASSFSTNTTVTIAFDSTAVLSNEAITDIAVGIVSNSSAERSTVFGIPTGTLLPFGSTALEPIGFAFCNGQAFNRTTEAPLFAVISTTFGSSSTSTFQTPDLRGRTIVALDNLGGTSANRLTSTAADTLGGTLGQESTSQAFTLTGSVSSHTLSSNEMPSHTHSTPEGFAVSGGALSTSAVWGTGNVNVNNVSGATGGGAGHVHNDTFATSSTDTVSVVQPSMAMPWIIKK